ncbi:MAG TPA: cytochrome c [Methylibium sp.]|nr:cytochrome c [Methylibium sp.]
MRRLVLGAALAAALAVAAIAWLNLRGEAPLVPDPTPRSVDAAQIERGAYLARAGHCAGCHTERGGAAYAGGRGITTPFGIVYASNLTPDDATGLGRWTAAEFRRALQHGRSRDGRLLYPAFPYTSTTRVSDTDADAILAFLRSLPPVVQPNRAHALRFPYDSQAALAVWRALYFRPGRFEPDAAQPAAWNRGAYLVEGLGHCGACHAARNAFGASDEGLGGGLIPVQNWYAPALDDAQEAGVADWPAADIVALLKTGRAPRASTLGPMAEVVLGSTRHLSEADLQAVALYLQRLPPSPSRRAAATAKSTPRGAKLYETHCAACHGERGEGAPGIYPALAGQRAVTLDPAANLVRVVLEGGFAPATAEHPRPYGMPPFATLLDDRDVAAVLDHVRASWGNAGSAVSPLDVLRWRASR